MNRTLAPHARAPRRAAFSLIELSVSLVVMAILLTAIGSAITLASHAIPAHRGSPARTIEATDVAGQLAAEFEAALHVSRRDTNRIAFTIGDRTGDGSPQRIEYRWSGQRGDPLLRRVDGEPFQPVLEHVDHFELSYETQPITRTFPGYLQPSSETVLSEHDSALNLGTIRIDADTWAGQLLRLEPDDELARWEITRARVRSRRASSTSTKPLLRVRGANLAGRPGDHVFDEKPIDVSSGLLNTFTWNTFELDEADRLMPGQGLTLTFEQHNGSDATMDLRYDDIQLLFPTGGLVWSSDAGSSWQRSNTHTLRHTIFGRLHTPTSDQQHTRHRLRRVRFTLTVDESAPAATLHRSASPVEAVPLLKRSYRLDFHHDPTTIDFNGDREPDWQLASGDSFRTQRLDDGIWRSDQTIWTSPGGDFNQPTTIYTRMRHRDMGKQGGPGITMNVHWGGGQFAPLAASIHRTSSGQHTFELTNGTDTTGEPRLLTLIEELPDAFVDVQITINPAQRTVNVRLNGDDIGSFRYQRESANGERRGIALGSPNNDGTAEFQYTRIEVHDEP